MALKQQDKNGIILMESPKLRARHAFTTRYGGVSEGIWESLNLGENRGDGPDAVCTNFCRVCEASGFPYDRMVFSKQVHGDEIRAVSASDIHKLFSDVPYEADGLMTDTPGLALVIFTADCVPILMHDPERGAVAAVHAGWRGTSKNIAGKAVSEMCRVFGCKPENLRAAIGPSIGKCCFETDRDVPKAVRLSLGADAERFIFPRGERQTLDLRGINRHQLTAAGVPNENIDVSDECTMCRHEKYWSHRYTRGCRGSMASLIML